MTNDIYIYESKDGGELLLQNDDLKIINCSFNQVYLALFGGNVEQNLDWWGNNLFEIENQMNSETERILKNIAITHSGISRLRNAVQKDLKFLKKYYDVEININLISYNHIEIYVALQNNGNELVIKFDCSENVKASLNFNSSGFYDIQLLITEGSEILEFEDNGFIVLN